MYLSDFTLVTTSFCRKDQKFSGSLKPVNQSALSPTQSPSKPEEAEKWRAKLPQTEAKIE
jgi:hypothetical protein